MLVKVAWRNIWRNKTRSLVLITTIILGLWAGMFVSAFVVGMMEQKVDNIIGLELSHFQVHHPMFRDEQKVSMVISNATDLKQQLDRDVDIKGYSERVIAMSMLNSPTKSGAIRVVGIDPEREAKVTILHDFMLEGTYLNTDKRKPILISKRLAESYKLSMRSKMVLTIQDIHGEIQSAAFRVAGIFDSNNGQFDDMNIFVKKEDLQMMIGVDDQVHEMAILLNSNSIAESSAEKYQLLHPDLEVKSWLDLSSGMRFMIEAMDIYTLVIVGIIMIALLFSIINTMLMAVMERTKEIGTLMAIGMAKSRVFGMIILETIFLNMVGGPIGLLISWLSISYFGKIGINLGSGAAYSDFGFSNLIYPSLDIGTYMQVTIMVLFMALLAAVYPARKALKLKPIEAIRKI